MISYHTISYHIRLLEIDIIYIYINIRILTTMKGYSPGITSTPACGLLAEETGEGCDGMGPSVCGAQSLADRAWPRCHLKRWKSSKNCDEWWINSGLIVINSG